MLAHGGLAFAKVGRDSSWRAVPMLCSADNGWSRRPEGSIFQQRFDCLIRPAAVRLGVDRVPLLETARHCSRQVSVPRSGLHALRRICPPAYGPPQECSSNTEAPVLRMWL